jgi:four helix bundle protein
LKNFRDLKVWDKAHTLALACYAVTTSFPKEELFGLISQIRRSGSSIGANIAEGCGRGSNADFQRFLHIAMGSACELEYQLLLAKDLHYLGPSEHQQANELVVEVKKMLAALIKRVDSERK